MALRIKQTPTYFWPVVVEYPVDGGKFLKETFDAEFKRLSKDEIQTILEDAATDKKKDADVVREVLVGWKGITDDDGALDFSATALETAQAIPLFDSSVVQAWMKSVSGAPVKN
jgi:hypothetical protein